MTTSVTAPETALVRDLHGLARVLAGLYGQDFVSLVLYGPAVDLERAPRDGEVQLLVVLTSTDLKTLEKAQDPMAAWWRSHRVAPLFIGRREFDRSLDVFPLEFLHMRSRYVLLHGEDVLAKMEISKEHIRLQLEEDLKTRAFWLRQFYVRDGRREQALRDTLADSCQGIVQICDGLLTLKDRPFLAQPEAALAALAAAYGVDPAPLRTLLAVARGELRPQHRELIDLAYAYDAVLNELIRIVDALE